MRRLIALLALATVAACGSDTSTNPANDKVEGSYSLRTVNGQPLPFTVQANGVTAVITSDVMTIAEGGSWTEVTAYRKSANGQTTNEVDADSGTWTRVGDTMTFNSNLVGTFQGSYAHGSVTFDDPGYLAVYSR